MQPRPFIARRIIKRPRLRVGDTDERHATWMEAFFDLVFVVAVSQVADRLPERLTPLGMLGYLLLFGPVWWAWIGATYYSDRFGTDDLSDRLFTIVVLGESIVAVVVGIEEVRWGWSGTVTALCGLLLAFSFWWIYFASLDASVIRDALRVGRVGIYELWLYAHLPLTAAIAAAGVGVWLAIEADSHTAPPSVERWLICGAAGLCFAALGTIYLAKAIAGSRRCTMRDAGVLWAGALGALLVAALGTRLVPVGILSLLAAVGTVLVIRDLAGRPPRTEPEPGTGAA